MLVIGLTGGIGSGKSVVAELFAKQGITVIDTDQLARELTQPGQPALISIIENIGKEILLPSGYLDRAALRKIVFADSHKRIWLEKLLHPLIREKMKLLAEHALSPYCIAVIPLLFETEKNPLVNRTLVVDATEEQQIQRTQLRDKLPEKDIRAILNTQLKREERLAKADDVIYNDNSANNLSAQVEKLHEFYLSLASKVML